MGMLDHRSSKVATVKDVTNFRKYVRARASHINKSIEDLRDFEKKAKINIETQIVVLGEMLEGITGSSQGAFNTGWKSLVKTKRAQEQAMENKLPVATAELQSKIEPSKEAGKLTDINVDEEPSKT